MAQDIVIKFDDDAAVAGWYRQMKLAKEYGELIDKAKQKKRDADKEADRAARKFTFDPKAITAFKLAAGASVAAAGAAAAAIALLGKAAVSSAMRVERLKNVLSAAYGDTDIGALKYKQFNKIVSETPLTIEQVTNSMLRLKNIGIEPTAVQFKNLGDIAIYQGKSIEDVVNIIETAAAGNLKALSGLNITAVKADKSGKDLKVTYDGVTSTIQNSASAIEKYIVSLGKLPAVAGFMGTLSGSLSEDLAEVKKSFSNLLAEVGEGLLPVIKDLVGYINILIDSFDPSTIIEFYQPIKDALLPALRGMYLSIMNLIDVFAMLNSNGKNSPSALTNVFTGLIDIIALTTNQISKFILLLSGIAASPVLQPLRDLVSGLAWIFADITKFAVEGDGGKSATAGMKKAMSADAQFNRNAQQLAKDTIGQMKDFARQYAEKQKALKAGQGIDEDAIKRAKEHQKALEELNKMLQQLAISYRNLEFSIKIDHAGSEEEKVRLQNMKDFLNRKDEYIKAQEKIKSLALSPAEKKNALGLLKDSYNQTEKLYKIEDKIDLIKASALDTAKEAAGVQETITRLTKREAEAAKKALDAKQESLKHSFDILNATTDANLSDNIIDINRQKGKSPKQIQAEIAIAESESYAFRLRNYVTFKEDEAKLAGKVYKQNDDADYIAMAAEARRKLANAWDKTDDASSKTLADKFWRWFGNALGANDNDAAIGELKDAFTSLAQTAIKAWDDATNQQIASNDKYIENLRSRRDALKESLDAELEMAKLGYANNVEAKQAEIDSINAKEKQAINEGIKLKKKQATTELVLSELQAGAAMVESVAKSFAANSGIPFGVGVAIAVAQIATMFSIFASYKSKIRSLKSEALFKGGRPVDYLEHGATGKTDLPGSGQSGHKIEGTNLVISAWEHIMNEKSTKKNLPFLNLMNKGYFDNVNLLNMLSTPNLSNSNEQIANIVLHKEQYTTGEHFDKAISKHLNGLISYMDSKPQYISHNGDLIEKKRGLTKIIKLY